MSMLQSTAVSVLEQMVEFSQARHEVLAGNIANLDTPGYVAQDMSVEDFQARLKRAIEESHQSPAEGASPGLWAAVGNHKISEVAQNSSSILYHDQSNVGAEYQVNEMVKNRLQHNLAVTILSQQYRLLEASISERA